MVSVSVRYLFYQPMDEKIKTWTLRFPVKENPYMERSHGSIGQSRCSMTSKRSIDWFLETSPARSFFSRAFALSTKTNTCLYSFDKSIKWHDFRSFFFGFVLFARFHFKVIPKSLYHFLICFIIIWRKSKLHFFLRSAQDLSRTPSAVLDLNLKCFRLAFWISG